MNTSNGPTRPIPADTAPVDTLCLQIDVPDDPEWIGAFYDAIMQLTYWMAWGRDDAHTGTLIARRWLAALDTLRRCDDQSPIRIPFSEMDVDMSVCEQLRFQDGKLQGLCCGEWSDITGQDFRALGEPDQQGDGAPQPDAGACQTYHAVFAASAKYLIPTVVNAGDVLTFSNPKGAGQDGTVSPWHCPDGSTFLAGGCLGGTGGVSGGDPAPAINHMRLIAKIGAVYYPADSGTITVPGGITGATVEIQANDSTLSDNSGSYSVDIEVCNNTATRYSHLFNFALGPQGWTASGPTVSDGWSGGKWLGHLGAFAYENRIYITVPVGATVDHVQIVMNIDKTEAGAIYMEGYVGPGPTGANTTLYSQGSSGSSTANRNHTLDFDITMIAGKQVLQVDATGSVSGTYNELLAVTFSGPGTDPF